MAYIDPTFSVNQEETLIAGSLIAPGGAGTAGGLSLGTSTASSTTGANFTGTLGKTVNGAFQFPIFKQPIAVVGIRVYTVVVPGSGVSGLAIQFMQGTSTMGAAVLSSTVGFADAVMVNPTYKSNGVVNVAPSYFTGTNSNEWSMNLTGTATGSGSGLGSYAMDLTYRNLFTT